MLCKFNIKDAFKHCPIQKDQWHLFGVPWLKNYYVLTRVTFGCQSSPKIFDTLVQAVCWIAINKYDVECILHLLDDFLTIDKPDSEGRLTFTSMLHIFNSLGIPLSENKLEGPCTCLEYLGMILNSEKNAVSLTYRKGRKV